MTGSAWRELHELHEDEARARLAEDLERLEVDLEREDRLTQYAPAIAMPDPLITTSPAPADRDVAELELPLAERLGVLFLPYARPPPIPP